MFDPKALSKTNFVFDPAYEGVENVEGIKVWRINNMKLEEINEKEYGQFYNGDSYIILKTTKKPNTSYDIFFWLGSKSTDDEIGAAAFKTVELDAYLGDAAVQHREVEGFETNELKSCFKEFIVLNGGIQSGFNYITQAEYKPRMLKFNVENKILLAKEVPYCAESLTSDDVYVLDHGHVLLQFNGKDANKDERRIAGDFLRKLKDKRKNCDYEIIDESTEGRNHTTLNSLPSMNIEKQKNVVSTNAKRLVRLTDQGGNMKYQLIQENVISFRNLDSTDAFFIYTNQQCYVWVGSNASVEEKRLGLTFAQKYMSDNSLGFKPITIFREGQESLEFKNSFDN